MITTGSVLYGTNDLRLVDTEVPRLNSGDVLVKIYYSGICGRQICEINGIYGGDKWLPHMMGHEAYGEVVDIGPDVRKASIGDKVVVSWIIGSGIDNQSNRKYTGEYGDINAGPVTTFMTYTITCESRVTKVDVDPIVGSLLGCAIPTGGGIVIHEVEAMPGDTICIVGLGGIGSAAALIAKYMHYNVIAIDNRDRSEYAGSIGVDRFINSSEEFVDISDMDSVIESTGSIEGMNLAIRITSRNGGKCIIAGNPMKGSKFSIDPYDLIHGKRIVGSWGGSTDPDRDLPMYAEMSDTVPYRKLVGAIYPFNEIHEAMESVGKINGRILLDMRE